MSTREELIKLAKEWGSREARPVFDIVEEGRRVYVLGNTYPFKDKLRGMGFKFDGDRRAWWIGKRSFAKIEDRVESLANPDLSILPNLNTVLKLGPAIEAYAAHGRLYLQGNTFPIKDRLKALGFRWDSKNWFIDDYLWGQVKSEVESLAKRVMPKEKPQPGPSRAPQGPSRRRPATENQITYALRLIRRIGYDWHDSELGQYMSRPPSETELRSMSSRQVSDIIDSLRDEFR